MTSPYDPQQQQYGPAQPPQPPYTGQIEPWQPQQPPYAQPHVAPKSTIGALALSFFLPGVGSLYAGDKTGGIIILVLWLLSIPALFIGIGFWTGLICWILGMILGYTDAQNWNRKHGIIS